MKLNEVTTMMKKIVAMGFLLLFVLSVIPFGLARVDADQMGIMVEERKVDDMENKRHEKGKDRLRLRQKKGELKEKFKEELKEKRQEFVDEVKDYAGEKKGEFVREARHKLNEERREMKVKFRERHKEFMDHSKDRAKKYFKEHDVRSGIKTKYVAKFRKDKGKFKDHHEHFTKIKERSKEAKGKYREHKQELREIRKAARDCTEDCGDEKAALRKGAKEHLLRTLNVMDRPLEKYTNRVDSAKHLTDAQKEIAHAAAADIQQNIDAARATVEALSEDATAEEFKAATKEVKDVWKDIRQKFKVMVGALSLTKSANVIDKQQEAYEGMDAKIAELAGAGVDTTSLEALQETYETQLDTLRAKQTAADDAWQAGVAAGEMSDYRAAQKEVYSSAKESHQTLREFMKLYREVSTR